MKRVYVTCNGQPLVYVPLTNRVPKDFEDGLDAQAREGFEDLAKALAYAHFHVGYMAASSDIPMHVEWWPSTLHDTPPFIWKPTGEGTWDMRIGPLLYEARLRDPEDHGRTLEQPLSA